MGPPSVCCDDCAESPVWCSSNPEKVKEVRLPLVESLSGLAFSRGGHSTRRCDFQDPVRNSLGREPQGRSQKYWQLLCAGGRNVDM